MSEIPITMTSAGAQPTPPNDLLANLITRVAEKYLDIQPTFRRDLLQTLPARLSGRWH